MSHRKPSIGEVLQFTLPDGRYAYGRVLHDSAVAFYRQTTSEPAGPPVGSTDFQFVVGVYSDVLRSDAVPIVGFDPQVYNNDDWPLPGVIVDPITGGKKIYEHGQIRKAIGDEWQGLEVVAVWDLHHLIDRLMGEGDKWMRGMNRFE